MKIISFFSFKGGVGRTALMVNLGAYWATQGRVVAMIDLDLAAPGLSYSPLLGDYLDSQGLGLGISDVLGLYYDYRPADPAENTLRFLPPHYLLRDMRPPAGKSWHPEGRLLVIDAGSRTFTNPGRVTEGVIQAIPARRPPADESEAKSSLRTLAAYLREDLESWRVPDGPAKDRPIDFLLIDSRTGFAELLDLSLGYLADSMVLVSSLNAQNLHGLQLTLSALIAEGRVPLDEFPSWVTLVFSPLPAGEDEAVFEALAAAHRVVRNSLRLTHSGELEQAPLSFSIHYTPVLATREALLAVEQPRSLYAQEVQAIAGHLIGEASDTTVQDELLQKAQRDALRAAGVVAALQPPSGRPVTITGQRPHPLADLPPWYWPLPSAEQTESARIARLNELMPANPNLELDRMSLATRLSWNSSFLSIAEKRRIMATLPKREQSQVDALLQVLETERQQFMRLNPERLAAVIKRYMEAQRQWAGLVLGDDKAGDRRFLLASFEEGKSPFPNWEMWPDYWLWLAHDLFVRLGDEERGLAAIDRAAAAAADEDEKRQVAEHLLERFEPGTVRQSVLETVEAKARALAPDDVWLNYYLAHYRLQGPTPDKQSAMELLEPLLANPPEKDGRKCWQLAALVLGRLPEIGIQAETASRRAVELEPDYAPAWNTLGNLYQDHLGRYEEAERAYRRAIDLDPKFSYPWNSLGNLYQRHLGRYEEAERAYRRAIDLDPKDAYPWYNLGNLYQGHLGRYEEAERAYRRAIDLDPKDAPSWHGLGLLYQYYFRLFGKAREAFEQGMAVEPKESFFPMNLGYLYVIKGDEEKGRAYLQQALSGFAQQQNVHANTLWLAIELSADEYITACLPEIQRRLQAGQELFDSATHLLLHALTTDDTEAINRCYQQALDALASYDDHLYLLIALYLLAGLRPETRKKAARLAVELLAVPETIRARFKDQPKPPEWLECYRPFAEGRSQGAGDPADLHLFFRDLTAPHGSEK